MKWTKKGFEEFSKGKMGNGGQNMYISAKGTLQRIFNFDINGDGYFDLPLANSHSMNEKPDIYVYDKLGQKEPLRLPSNGSFDATFADLTGNGTDDLIVACQHNGVHSDVEAIIYFASEIGLSEKYKTELCVPNSLGVAAGDFKGTGKKSLAFICDKKIRIFDQCGCGIEDSVFTDVDISALSVAAGDLDGDGFDDLYVFHQETGTLAVYWGGEDGINPDRKTEFGKAASVHQGYASSTTVGRQSYRHMGWRCNVLKLGDKTVTFRSEDNFAVFESFDKNRKAVEEIRIEAMPAKDPDPVDWEVVFAGNGPMHATCGDLRNNGSHDIVIAVATYFDKINDIIVLWEDENYSLDKATRIPVRAPRVVEIGPMGKDEKNYLFVTQSCEDDNLNIDTAVFSFNADKTVKHECDIATQEPTRLMSGKTYTDGRYQLVAINHEGELRLGVDNVSIFLGGEDGFDPDRRLDFPASAATDIIMADFNDDGKTDVLVVNCSENAPTSRVPGSFLYLNGPDGFDIKNKKFNFRSDLSHGVAVGDFRKCGYLDVIMGGISSRELKIFEGGPNGFDFENPKLLVMGPDPEKYLEESANLSMSQKRDNLTPEINNSYAQVRWLFTADFNGDGYLDLFVSQIYGNRSFIFWGGPDGFSPDRMQELATDGVASANAADLNGNGYLDLVCASHQSLGHSIKNEAGKIVIYWGGKDGFKENRKSQLPTWCCNALTIHDFNNDGLLDIFGTAYNNGRCRDIDSKMYFQSKDGMFHINNYQDIFSHSGCGCLAGDFNGNGYIDLAVASHKAYGNHVNYSYVFWGGEDGINENRYTKLPCRGPHGMHSVDIGNIMDRSDSEYYTSEAYEAKNGEKAVKASWVAENGKKTWVKISLRSAKTLAELETAEWSESFENGADISALNLTGFVQYKLELGAKCGCGTPRVTEVTIDFE